MCYYISFKVNIPEPADYFPDIQWDDRITIDFGASDDIIAYGFSEHPVIYRNREVKGFKNKIPCFVQLKDQAAFFNPGLYPIADLPDTDGAAVKQ